MEHRIEYVVTANETSTNTSLDDKEAVDLSITSYSQAFSTVMKVEKVSLPIICLVGLIGNSLSTITFLRKPLRKARCSLYLAYRGISDSGFLISLLLIWISGTFELNLSRIKGLCQLTIFMTYVCGCVSVWLCVFITFDNFLLLRLPHISRRLCRNLVYKISTGVLVLIAVGIYNSAIWIVHEDCSHNEQYFSVTQILVYCDTLLTLVIPTVIMLVLLSVITCRLIQILHVRKLHSNLVEKITNGERPTKPILPIAKVTKMLFVVSITFFVLNFPSHVIRITLLIGSFTRGHKTAPVIQATLQVSFQLLYYLSFSINFFIYAMFGSNFRKSFNKTFGVRHTPTRTAFEQREAVNLVHRRRQNSISVDEKAHHVPLISLHIRHKYCHNS